MPSASDTAYPRFKINPSAKELNELYSPTVYELAFARERARQPIQRAGLLLLLKRFQRLGYFVSCAEIPVPIVRHIFRCAAFTDSLEQLQVYDTGTARDRHTTLIREFPRRHRVRPSCQTGNRRDLPAGRADPRRFARHYGRDITSWISSRRTNPMCVPIQSTPTPKVKAPPSLLWHIWLGIQLMPRIRNWKELNLCHPPGERRGNAVSDNSLLERVASVAKGFILTLDLGVCLRADCTRNEC
jgi:hypothetical protein